MPDTTCSSCNSDYQKCHCDVLMVANASGFEELLITESLENDDGDWVVNTKNRGWITFKGLKRSWVGMAASQPKSNDDSVEVQSWTFEGRKLNTEPGEC